MPLTNLNRRLDSASRQRRSEKINRKQIFKWLLIGLVFVIYLYMSARFIYGSIRKIQVGVVSTAAAFKNENLDDVKSSLELVEDGVHSLEGSLNWVIWVRIIPIIGDYYADARHFTKAAEYELTAANMIVDKLLPQKEELGFRGTPTPGQDKVVQMAKVMEKVVPFLDQIEPELEKASKEVQSVNVAKYPEKIAGRDLRSRVEVAKNFITGAALAVRDAKPAIQQLPSALGVPTEKNYLIIFQNDKELRPTGGFMTAYAFLSINNGRISSSSSDDIYRLDEKLLNVCKSVICPLTPPAPIVRYLPEVNGKPRTAWSMRDSNISPDVPTSLGYFERMYGFLKDVPKYDGIILIDTKVVEELVKITGPIEVYGTTYSAETDPRCNCPNVIYELQNYAAVIEKGQEDRKAVLGTLMSQILARSLGAATDKMPAFINAGVNLANQKHIIFYMKDQKMEDALGNLGWTGVINQSAEDYLHLNDANFAGAKSNLYVQQEVTLDIDTNSTPVKHKLIIKYSNPYSYSTWLNAINRDYVRVYVPQGSVLTGSKGSEVKVTTIDSELNRTVFEAFIQVRPQNSTVLEFEYDVLRNPTANGKYPLLIQKQPGKKGFHYTIKVNGVVKEQFDLDSDKNLQIGI